MNKHINVISGIVIGIIVMAITLAVFFLSNQIEGITSIKWLSLSFVLLSELVLFTAVVAVLIHTSKTSKVLISSGSIVTLFIYWVATVTSSIFANTFKGNINKFVTIQVLLIGITAVIIIILVALAKKAKIEDEKILSSRLFMEDCEKHLYILKSENKYAEYKGKLNSLYETVKYSDKNGNSSADSGILKSIKDLEKVIKENESTVDLEEIINEIASLLKQRKAEVLQIKRGGF